MLLCRELFLPRFRRHNVPQAIRHKMNGALVPQGFPAALQTPQRTASPDAKSGVARGAPSQGRTGPDTSHLVRHGAFLVPEPIQEFFPRVQLGVVKHELEQFFQRDAHSLVRTHAKHAHDVVPVDSEVVHS